MSNAITDLDALLIATDATHEHGTAVIQAMKAVVHFTGKCPDFPPALHAWLEERVTKADKADQVLKTTASKQRALANAFGYTPSRGNPHDYGERNLKMVWDIWHIHKSSDLSLSKAIDRYVTANPTAISASGSTDYIRDLIAKHRNEISDLYDEWVDLMDSNRTSYKVLV